MSNPNDAKQLEKERRRQQQGGGTAIEALECLDASLTAKVQEEQQHPKKQKIPQTWFHKKKNPLAKPANAIPPELERLDAKIDAKQQQAFHLRPASKTNDNATIHRTSVGPTDLERLDAAIDAKNITRDVELGGLHDNYYDDTTETEITTATIVNEDTIAEEKRIQTLAEERVRNEIQSTIAKAEIVELPNHSKSNRLAYSLLITGTILLAISSVIVTLGMTLWQSEPSIPVPEIVKYLQTISSEETLRYPLPTDNPTSAERALHWFGQQQDTMKLPTTERDEQLLLQAFVLTTLWFQSTQPNLDPIETIRNCQWTPMVCDESSGEIVELHLNEFALEGTIPKDLGSFTKLSVLNLPRNSLTGNVPSELGSLSLLTNLLLFDNALQGTFPTEIGGLTNLQRLEFGRNQFSGPLPTELGRLTQLTSLDFTDNAFTGQIPTELAGLSGGSVLDVSLNAFSGTIPTEFAEMSSLLGLVIADTNIGGTIPKLLPPNLVTLILVNNQLTGTIPTELGLLTSVQSILLFNNTLDSTIPTELGSLAALTRLSLGRNRLRDSLPSELLTGLPNLSTLELDDSGLSGPIAAVLGSWTNTLQVLDLSSNEFEGTIPTELATYTLLQELYLARNADITGSIPSELAALTDMYRFDVSSCPQLVGTVPPELMAWSDISWALLNHTGLTGVFPWCDANGTHSDLDLFVADCSNVQCDCCHYCCSEDQGCVET